MDGWMDGWMDRKTWMIGVGNVGFVYWVFFNWLQMD